MRQTVWVYEGSDISIIWNDNVPTVTPTRRGSGIHVSIDHGAYDSSKFVQIICRWPRGLEPVVNVYYDNADHFVDVVNPPAATDQEPLVTAS